MSEQSRWKGRSCPPDRRRRGLLGRLLLGTVALVAMMAALVVAPSAADAAPVVWRLDGVTATGSRTLSGTFTYDADSNTYSNVNITVFEGGNTFQFNHAIRPDISDANTIIVGQEPQGSDQTGNRIVRIRYTSALTDAGGLAPVNTTTPNSFVGLCNDANCVNLGVFSFVDGGNVITGQRWFVQGARMGSPGRTVRGSFVYDANTNTYADVDLTSEGFPEGTIVFTDSIRTDIDTASSGHFGQRPQGSDQTDALITRIRYQTALTNAGGTIDINTVSPNSFIGRCNDASCVNIGAFGIYNAGRVTTNPLQAPTITSGSPVEANENISLVADVEATDDFDAEGSGLSYSLGGTDASLFSINGGNGQISFNTPADFEDPRDAGQDNNYDVTVTVTDLDGLSDTLNLQIRIQNVNEAPSLADIADQSVDEGSSLSIPLSASDPEGPSGLGLSSSGLPAFCSLTDNGDGTGSIDCNPVFGDAGTSNVTVSVADPAGLQDSDSFDLTVNNVNQGPVLTPIADQAVDENGNLSIPVSASDPDGDSLAFSQSGLPSFCTLNNAGDGTGTIDCNPGFSDAGTTTVTVTVTDGGDPALQDSDSFDLTVNNVNRAPDLAAIANQTVDEGSPLVIPLTGADQDGDGLSYSATGLPSFCTLNDAGDGAGTIDCNPGFSDAGTYPMSVILSDNGSPVLTDTEPFELTVNNINQGPALTPIADQAVDENQPLVVPIAATDPDGDNLTLGANAPSFCLLADGGDGTGQLSCNPGFDDAGTYEIEVSVADDGNPSIGAALAFQLTVNNVNRDPVLTDIADQSVDEGQTTSIPVSSSDPDGDGLTLMATGLPSFCSLSDAGDGTGSIDCAPGFLDSGSYPISVMSTDDGSPNLTAFDSFVLTVVEINDPPVVEAGPNAEITVPDPAVMAGSANDDGNPNPPGALTFQWSVISGSGNVIFADATSPTTSVVFEGGGDFVLRLTASDGQLTGFDDVTITVNNPLGCTIFGTNGPDDLVGTPGNDVICGFDGNDDINAGLGDDTVFGGAGNDKMVGGGGNDVMSSPSGTNTFDGQGGNDTMTGGGGPDTMDGGGGSDTMFGNGGNDVLRGGTGGDTITGGSGNDELRGGGGRDKLRDAAGDDMLFGEGGNDSLRDLVGTNLLDGGAGNNRCTDANGTSSC